MKFGKIVRGLTIVSSLIAIGCAEEVSYHDSDHEDRHIHYHDHDGYDASVVHVRVDDNGDRDQPVAQAPPPRPLPDQQDAPPPQYDNGGAPVDAVSEAPDYDNGGDATYFQNDLQQYGDWVVTADFGRCFRPHGIAVGWRPYSQGHWVYTDEGWLWASDEPYGWA